MACVNRLPWRCCYICLAGAGMSMIGPTCTSPRISPHLPAPPCISLRLPVSPRISLHLPTSPCISPHLPASPRISLQIRADPCISLNLPASLRISLHLPASPQDHRAGAAPAAGGARRVWHCQNRAHTVRRDAHTAYCSQWHERITAHGGAAPGEAA